MGEACTSSREAGAEQTTLESRRVLYFSHPPSHGAVLHTLCTSSGYFISTTDGENGGEGDIVVD